MNRINYSIIIPHKNSPELLQRCLNSIPQREDVEIIVVDDNSNNFEEIKGIVKPFPRVLLYSNRGKYAGGARNTGIKNANGKWILFSDADDFFHKDFLNATDCYLESDFQIVFFDADCCYSETLKKAPNRNKNISPAIETNDIERLKWMVMPVWAKMYSSEFLIKNSIKFDEVIASNDVMFTYHCSYYAKKCTIDKFVLYCNTINLNSLCYQLNLKNIESRTDVRYRANEYLFQIGKNKYHGNLLSLYLYYKNWGFGFFLRKMCIYVKLSRFIFIVLDLKMLIIKIPALIVNKGSSGRFIQKFGDN